ncbi:MAG: hypothetical protein V1921_00935 [Candidatus Altiarchaeota archaeon]
MRLKHRIIACILLSAIVSGLAQAEGLSFINISIENTPPHVGRIETPESLIMEGASIILSCNSTITDLNGREDISTVSGLLWNSNYSSESSQDNPRDHYASYQTTFSNVDNLSKRASVFFNIQPEASLGEWKCKLTAADKSSASGYNVTEITLYSAACSNNISDAGEELTDCGGTLCPPCLSGDDIILTANPGEAVTAEIVLSSATPQHMTIAGHYSSDLQSQAGTIRRSRAYVSPETADLQERGRAYFTLSVEVPSNASSGTYTGTLAFTTNTTVTLDLNLTLNVLLGDVPPSVGGVRITYPIVLEPNITKTVECNGTLRDENGFDNIRIVNITFTNVETREGISPNETATNQTSELEGIAAAKFLIEPATRTGLWRCNVNAEDRVGLTGSNYADAIVYNLSCANDMLDADEELIDCGGDCPPCLIGEDILVRGRSGQREAASTVFTSYASQALTVTGFTIADLISGSGRIQSARVRINPQTSVIKAGESAEFGLIYELDYGLNKTVYNGTITALTNTSVTASIQNAIEIISRDRGYIKLEVECSCLNQPVYLRALDEYDGQPMENASIKVGLGDVQYDSMLTDPGGNAAFIPRDEGRYNITASKEGYITEEVLSNIVICGLEPTCDDGILNQNETQVDCGGECLPCSCRDGILNGNEESVDCGGECLPCHCSDGIFSGDEEGIDCGSKCPPCPQLSSFPLMIIEIPGYATIGENITITTADELGRKLQSLIIVQSPNDGIDYYRTNREGTAIVNVDAMGLWRVKASKPGYNPVDSTIIVLDKTVIGGGSILGTILTMSLYTRWWRRRRVYTLADRSSLMALYDSEKLRKYGKIAATDDILENLDDSIKQNVKAVSLSQEELENSDRIANEFSIDHELSNLLVVAERMKAKEIITVSDIPDELQSRYKMIMIRNIDEIV